MKRFLSIIVLLSLGTTQAVDRVAYVEKQVVRYVDGKPVAVKETVAVVVSEPDPAPVVVKAVPAVTAVKTFRNGEYDPDHQCNRCGRSQYRIAGWLPSGQHRHVCSACGHNWIH